MNRHQVFCLLYAGKGNEMKKNNDELMIKIDEINRRLKDLEDAMLKNQTGKVVAIAEKAEKKNHNWNFLNSIIYRSSA